ncbi:trypsin-1-like [Xylocopa sonorina]|uniref:trypsin-1-like n=1 Tax=Xylocopa sonorina TaxID=1818115 RepID=UPI00403AC823
MFRSVLLVVLIAGCLGAEVDVQRLLPDSQIVGGIPVDILNHPYQLSLQTSGHICGASIISTKWAITAAHCVGSPASRYTLRAGNTNKNLGTSYTLKSITKHPKYDSRTIDYDIALLEINGKIQLNDRAQPVRLPSREPSAGTMVNVTGWGTVQQGGSTTTNLMKVSVPIVSRKQCNDVYSSMNTITNQMICAGYTSGGKDACQGDSGGPLTANGVLYGIVSWGYGCAQPKYPGVYTNVASLRSWIKSISGV